MASKWETDGDIGWEDGNTLNAADLEDTFKASQVPLGGIIPWCKSLTGAPTLASSYVECNGQTLSDANSPFNGQVIPNLNGAVGAGLKGYFLRGHSSSGVTETSQNLAHTHVQTAFQTYAGGQQRFWVDGNTTSGFAGTTETSTLSSGGTEARPHSYSVVFIMRVK